MDNKLFIGTLRINDILYISFSDKQSDFERQLLISNPEFVDEDLNKISEQMNIPVHKPF
ncbi:hypothetical protein [Paenibacillus sp. FSL H7-0331]|uniref:hypothetical protein n=1 Tax=Paenibacillus sp. FSL H7-0331 TaxID=1920421 RepID=UPI0015C31EF3|nr:hypothetical protein [Paenibacillus sp. FSL H7-0331]